MNNEQSTSTDEMMRLPDGPKTPTFLQKLHWLADPVGYLEQAAAAGDGDIFTVRTSKYPRVLVSHPQALQQIFTNDRKQLTQAIDRTDLPSDVPDLEFQQNGSFIHKLRKRDAQSLSVKEAMMEHIQRFDRFNQVDVELQERLGLKT